MKIRKLRVTNLTQDGLKPNEVAEYWWEPGFQNMTDRHGRVQQSANMTVWQEWQVWQEYGKHVMYGKSMAEISRAHVQQNKVVAAEKEKCGRVPN